MAYNERLAERLRAIYEGKKGVVEKKMFGGIAFMVHGHMSCGVTGSTLMARIGPEQYNKALARKHVREMDFTGRSLKGFVYIDPEGIKTKKALASWVDLSLKFVATLPPK